MPIVLKSFKIKVEILKASSTPPKIVRDRSVLRSSKSTQGAGSQPNFQNVVCVTSLANHVITCDLIKQGVIYLQEDNRPHSCDLKVG